MSYKNHLHDLHEHVLQERADHDMLVRTAYGVSNAVTDPGIITNIKKPCVDMSASELNVCGMMYPLATMRGRSQLGRISARRD